LPAAVKPVGLLTVHWSERDLFTLAVGLYSLGAAHGLWLRRKGFERDPRLNYGLLLTGGILHTGALLQRGLALGRCPVTNLFEAIVFASWAIVAGCLTVGLWPRFRSLGAFVAPWLVGLGLLALLPGLDTHPPWPQVPAAWATLHRSFILLACGSFGLAAATGLMLLMQDYDLRHAAFRALRACLPSIQWLEQTLGWAIRIGLALLTVGLGLGTVYLKQRRGLYFSADPAVVYWWAVWLVYLGLVMMQWRFKQPIRRLAWTVVGSFAGVALTFWAFYLLSPLHRPARGPAPTRQGSVVYLHGAHAPTPGLGNGLLLRGLAAGPRLGRQPGLGA
jgi:ABC-type uncharacterized transport system permease subunit